MLLVLAGLYYYTTTPAAISKTADCAGCTLVTEAESAYNYIQIADSESKFFGPQVNLILNEARPSTQSITRASSRANNPLDLLTGGGPWDYFAVTPYFYPDRDPASVKSLAMLGSATGTIPKQFLGDLRCRCEDRRRGDRPEDY